MVFIDFICAVGFGLHVLIDAGKDFEDHAETGAGLTEIDADGSHEFDSVIDAEICTGTNPFITFVFFPVRIEAIFSECVLIKLNLCITYT